MSDINLSLIPKFVDNMLSPVAKEAGEALADIIKVARIPISDYLKKHEVELNVALNKLKIELEKIPDNNIIPPRAYIVGPAIERMFKYDLEEEHIIEAFSKLIPASMDKEKMNTVHPQLFDVVEKMSPLDGKIFKIACLENMGSLWTIRPYSTFVMPETIFPWITNYNLLIRDYKLILLPPEEFKYYNVTNLIEAYNSIIYLSNLGLIKEGSTHKYSITSQIFLDSEIYVRLLKLLKCLQKQMNSKITLQSNIPVFSWKATGLGFNLAKILGLIEY